MHQTTSLRRKIRLPDYWLNRDCHEHWAVMKSIFNADRDACLVCGRQAPELNCVFNYWLTTEWSGSVARLCCSACINKHCVFDESLQEVLLLYHLSKDAWKP